MAFRPCSFNACVSVPIDDDEQLELTKRYTYRLERTDELDRRIDINTTSGTLTVIDDPTDGEYVEGIVHILMTVSMPHYSRGGIKAGQNSIQCPRGE